jgi:hypothetical protein
MDKNIHELVARYNAGQASDADLKQIEKLIETGSIELTDLKQLEQLDAQVMKFEFAEPSSSLDDRFYHMLALEKGSKSTFSWRGLFSWPELAPRLAIASVLLIIGVGIGYMIRPTGVADGKQIDLLSEQVAEMKEMMMLTMLEKESATERLKAVRLTQEMDRASEKVTGALIETLNNDEDINVRLAALEALKPYVASGNVRQELIRSIAKQESPLVQVTLADMMAALQVKSSVKELEKIVKSDKTPKDVKNRIQKSIDILI